MTVSTWNAPSGAVDELSARKLAAFARIEDDFTASFSFVQEAHGQRRFTAFPLANTVRYLHALYICECKDRLLSIPSSSERYEGERCLELLRDWQEGRAAAVVAFIHRKLDHLPFAEVSAQIEAATRAGDTLIASRLTSGRAVLLNRNFALSYALDAIFALAPAQLRAEAQQLCQQAGHTPAEIDRQLAELRSDLYAYVPSPPLARRNMLLMNRIGEQVMDGDGDRPGKRTDRVLPPEPPATSATPELPYAEAPIPGMMTLVSLRWNGPALIEAPHDAPAPTAGG